MSSITSKAVHHFRSYLIFGHFFDFKSLFGFWPGSCLCFRVWAGFVLVGGPYKTQAQIAELNLNANVRSFEVKSNTKKGIDRNKLLNCATYSKAAYCSNVVKFVQAFDIRSVWYLLISTCGVLHFSELTLPWKSMKNMMPLWIRSLLSKIILFYAKYDSK